MRRIASSFNLISGFFLLLFALTSNAIELYAQASPRDIKLGVWEYAAVSESNLETILAGRVLAIRRTQDETARLLDLWARSGSADDAVLDRLMRTLDISEKEFEDAFLAKRAAAGKNFQRQWSSIITAGLDLGITDPRSSVAYLFYPSNTQDGTMTRVAKAILAWDGNSPGDLFKAVKAADPSKPAIVSMRELNKALVDGGLPPDVMRNAAAITARQKAAQKMVRAKVLATRTASYTKFRGSNPNGSRSIYGNGDIGSWPTAADPDASMDIDWTVFGVDPNATAELRDQCISDLVVELVGKNSGLTLADFDVVITAEGHEAAAGVFETEGGIDWAKRNMKRVTIVNFDGTSRTYELGTGDPIKEMAMAEHMAKFRDLATKNGDYEKLFDTKGFLKSSLFNDPNNSAAEALWNKYMDMLSDFGIDYYRSRSSTATGGCLDMAKHLQEEVINRKHEPKAKLKKTLKYVSRADNISRGVPGLEKMLASDPLLSDPAYRDVVDLSRQISRATDAQVDAIIRERFGDVPDSGLQELGAKARRAILRMSEVAFQAEMDRIILEIPDKAVRKAALDKLTDDFRIVADEGGEYGELSRIAVEQISKVQEANDAGTIDAIKKNYNSLEKIRNSEQGLISQTVEFLKQTKLGNKMLEKGGKLLELGKKPVFDPVEPKYRSSTVEFVSSVADEVRVQNLKVVDYLASAAMWTAVIDDVRKSKSDAELAIALSKTLVNNTFFGMVLNSAYAGVVMGDNDALAKAVMYLIVPETALPALVEALGNTAINLGAQTLFEAQMERVYKATTFDKDGKIDDFSGFGMKGEEGSIFFVDTMCDGAPEMVAQDIIARSKATDFGSGSNAIAIRAIAKSIRATVDNGNPLIFTEDGSLMKAVSGIKKTNDDISDFAKAIGVEIPLSANNESDLPGGLDKGQTGAFLLLFRQREKSRLEARQALAAAIVRTFEERNRAEVALDSGKAKEEYDALLKIFEELGITTEGQKSLDQEGAPYNLITNWTTSTREKQVTAVKAVQKFKDAYSFVLQVRSSAESISQNNLGESYQSSPRPLTGSLPLTANPDIDSKNARAYLGLIAPLGEATVRDLELIKKAKLEGAYDADIFRRLYEVRLKIAYWSNRMDAARDAQSLHWKIEIFDKKALYDQHSEAAKTVSELRVQESAIEEEFRKHYELNGKIIVDLTGPESIESGQEARLTCTVRLRDVKGQINEIPAEIMKQIKFAWTSGRANLGEDLRRERSYKLDSPGDHAFTVVVKRYTTEARKPVVRELGRASLTVKVTETKESPTPTPTPTGSPTPSPSGSSTPTPKPPTPSVSPTPSTGPPKFSGSIFANWEGGNQGNVLNLKRKDVVLKNNVGSGTISANVHVEWGRISNPKDVEAWNAKMKDFKPGMESFSIADFKGYIVEKPLTYKPAIWSGDIGWTGHEGISAGGNGAVLKGDEVIKFKYSVSSATGSGVEIGKPPYETEGAAARDEARAILNGLGLSADGKINVVPYTPLKPKSIATVRLVPSSNRTLKSGDVVTIQAIVENAGEAKQPLQFNWTGDHAGSGASVTFLAKKPGKQKLSVDVPSVGSASVEFEVGDLTAELKLVSPAAAKVKVGAPVTFSANLMSEGTAVSGNYIYRFEASPEVKFDTNESAGKRTNAVFSKPGREKVWVEVFERKGEILEPVDKSEQIEIEVGFPELRIIFDQPQPLIGKPVKARVEVDPAELKNIDFRWELPANAKQTLQSPDVREVTFIPQNTNPITVKVNARVPFSGEDLGAKEATLRAQQYNVTVKILGAEGSKPQIWREGVGLVLVENAIAVHQFVGMRAEVSPALDGVRYEWSVNDDTHIAGSSISQQIRVSRSQVGGGEAMVIVKNKEGLELGRATGSFSVSISQVDVDKAKDMGGIAEKMAEAKSLVAKGQLDEGIALIGQVVVATPKNTEAQNLSTKWKQDRTTIQTQLAKVKALMDKKGFTDAARELAPAKDLHNQYPPVVAIERELINRKTVNDQSAGASDAAIKRGTALSDQRKWPDAVKEFDSAIKADPANVEAHRLRGRAKREAGDLSGSLADFNTAVNLDPNNYQSVLGRGLTKQRLNDAVGAMADFDRGIQLKPDYAGGYTNRARLKLDSKDFAGAKADYDSAIRLDPAPASSWINRGLAKANLTDYRGAIADYTKAIEIDPKNGIPYNNRGIAKQRSGDLNGALADFEKALEVDPNYKSPQTNLAKLKEQIAGGSTVAPASTSAGYYQLDFPSHFSHGRKEPPFLEGGIPVSGYNGGESPMVWLAKCKTPNADGVCYPTHLEWSVPGYQSNAIMLSTNLSWWGDQLQGKPAYRLTVEASGGARKSFDLVVGTHVAEWNGGSINTSTPSLSVRAGVPGPSRRWFINRFDLGSMAVTRVSVDLLNAPPYGTDASSVVEIHGITLVRSGSASGQVPVTTPQPTPAGAAVVTASTGANLAKNRPAKQSSIYLGSKPSGAQGAVDGVKNGEFGFHTQSEPNPWWQVDLGGVKPLTEIRIFNRLDCCRERARTIEILLSDDGLNWRRVFTNNGTIFGGSDGNPLKVSLSGKSARYVRLQLVGTNYFHLDEVEIY